MTALYTETVQEPECRAMVFGGKIYATFRAWPGAGLKYLKNKDGTKREFRSNREAIAAAQEHTARLGLRSQVVEASSDAEARVAKALGVDQWMRSKREDRKAAYVERRPGKRAFTVMKGRV